MSELLGDCKRTLGLQSAVDVGCGLGYFSDVLNSIGLAVTSFDAREENIGEARRRHPHIRFSQADVQQPAIMSLGRFDLVFCFGVLYHLENPLIAVRHLYGMTGKLLLAESVIFPGNEPTMALIDEELHEDQGLNHIAFYPTEACLVKMLYRAGFGSVYKLRNQPAHPDYKTTLHSRRVRTVLAASHQPLNSRLLSRVQEPRSPIRPWDPVSGLVLETSPVQKLRRFAKKPLPDKIKTIKRIVKGRQVEQNNTND